MRRYSVFFTLAPQNAQDTLKSIMNIGKKLMQQIFNAFLFIFNTVIRFYSLRLSSVNETPAAAFDKHIIDSRGGGYTTRNVIY